MKLYAIILAILLAFAAEMPATRAQSPLVDGLVTKIDVPGGKLTIRHGPMKKFDMDDGMTMVFRVTDPAMLKAVKVGEKVKFDADRINGQFTVTRIERTK
jgi:Cu/Ag efflux protein CusF